MAFFLYRSNRTEWLVDQLDGLLERDRRGPLEREHIVVEGRGMERWLSQQLARRHGIWANPGFVFPRQIVQRALDAVLGEATVVGGVATQLDGSADPYEPEVLLWSIAELLPDLLADAILAPVFAPVQHYLQIEDPGERRLLALAERIARSFDDYVVYRPDMVLRWQDPTLDAELAEVQRWQPALWRALVERLGPGHMALRSELYFAALRRGARPEQGFPGRLSLFGLSSMAPLYLRMLAGLSTQVDLHLFMLDPSQQFWADIESPVRAARRARLSGLSEEDLHLDAGNPLLAALGKQGRDFQRVLDQLEPAAEPVAEAFSEPTGDTLLQLLQRDIRDLLQRRPARESDPTAALVIEAEPPLAWADDDDSLTVHSCHSPMREVEVLQDQLLDLFARDPGLAPSDVVVMAPDIDTYVPYIDAVFGAADEAVRIRHSVADRGVRVSHSSIDAFLKLLDTLGGRFTAPEVLDLLACEPIRTAQGIALDDLGALQRWLNEAGIRWGEDAAHRAELGHPALDQNTWRFGLDRLLLGHALPTAGRALFAGVLPYDEIEGGAAELAGKLAGFCDQLFSRRRPFAAARSLASWRELLSELLAELLEENDDNRHEHALIRGALDRLVERAELAGYRAAIDLPALQVQLEALLEGRRSSQGFLTGGVTFCSTVPMRAIPFQVVCLLGLDDAAFPRGLRSPGFDLMQQRERPGDRDPRDDDRYVFLEALLSARARLILSYQGRSLRDNAGLPASVVVRELLDAVSESVYLAGLEADGVLRGSPAMRQAVLERLVVEHPLQAFSPRYFDAAASPRLFSYSAQHRGTAAAMRVERQPRPLFVAGALPEFEEARPAVTVATLERFFRAPTKMLLQQGLGLHLEEGEDELDATEPIELNGLQHWQIFDAALSSRRAGIDAGTVRAVARASGALPLQAMGEVLLDSGLPIAEELCALAAAHCSGAPLEDLDLAIELEGGLVTGLLRGLWPAGLVQVQFSKIRGHHQLGLWIRHLLLNAVAPDAAPRTSLLIGREAKKGAVERVRFAPVSDARSRLCELLELYLTGLRLPLPFFERASWSWAQEIFAKPDKPERAWAAAFKAYEGSSFGGPGDRQDRYVQQVYADLDPLRVAYPVGLPSGAKVPGFDAVASAVYLPLLEHREVLS